MVGGLLIQTLRNTVSHTCKQRFDQFSTACTEQPVVYDEATGEAVVVDTTSGGLRPYGVDAVFLAHSSAYDGTLESGKPCMSGCTLPGPSVRDMGFARAWRRTLLSCSNSCAGCRTFDTSTVHFNSTTTVLQYRSSRTSLSASTRAADAVVAQIAA